MMDTIKYASTRFNHDSGLYHEWIYQGDKVVAKVMSEDDSYWWVIILNNSISRGYRTVADAKDVLFKTLESMTKEVK